MHVTMKLSGSIDLLDRCHCLQGVAQTAIRCSTAPHIPNLLRDQHRTLFRATGLVDLQSPSSPYALPLSNCCRCLTGVCTRDRRTHSVREPLRHRPFDEQVRLVLHVT